VTLAIHDTSFLQRPQLLPWKTALRLRRTTGMAVRRSAAIIVPSTWTAETLVDRYPQAAGKTHVVPLAPAVRFDESAPPAADTLPPRFCLYVGRRQQRKNVALLLRAYADATRRERKVPPLLLLGPVSPEDDSLGALAKELGVAERVLIRGYTDAGTLAAAYERADFFCYPCRYEGFGLPLVEAMSHGCAVIAADEGGLPETLGDAGKLVPPDSLPAWSDAIVALAGSPETREELRHAGRRRARQFTWAQTARELLAAAHACVGTPVVDRTGNR
jgi:glycosyltransferase involved in cell wall biosynthesis